MPTCPLAHLPTGSVAENAQRKFTCIYTDRDPSSPSEDRPPTKRRVVETTGDARSPLYVSYSHQNDGDGDGCEALVHIRSLDTTHPLGPSAWRITHTDSMLTLQCER